MSTTAMKSLVGPMRRLKGWSLIELTIILVVLSILCAILAPVIGRFVRNAKVVRCREDVQAIGCVIWMYIEDTANSYFFIDPGNQNGFASREPAGGSAPDQGSLNRVNMLVSDGDIPELETTLAGVGPANADEWLEKVNNAEVDFLEDHLVTNTPGYRVPTGLTNPAADLMFARSESGGFNSEFAWRGAYMTAPIDPDPWGNRYAVNAKYLDPRADTPGTTSADSLGRENDVVVLSAGSDEEVDTYFTKDGITPGDDDIIYVLSANARP